jgi:transcriptional regulator GlxA family with amidase domain
MSGQARRVVLVVFDGMQLLNVLGPAEVFDAANRVLEGRPGYRVLVASSDGGAVRSSPGLRIATDAALAHIRARGLDTLVVAGGMNIHDVSCDPRLAGELRRLAAGARRTCSVCTGAFLLAGAGLLNGRRATTHWAFCAELARGHPEVSVEPDRIFVRDGATITSAGASAGIDLALALVQEDHGADVARKVARWLVVFLQRPGGQSQFSERLSLPTTTNSHVRALLDQIAADPTADHRHAQLARRVSLSERHLRRVFFEETHTTPARFVERVRVESARAMLDQEPATIEAVARRSGFGSPETMRRAFLRVIGIGPADYRERFQRADPRAPSPTAIR